MPTSTRRHLLVLALSGLAVFASAPGHADAESEAVQTTARHWLAETDAGSHGAAWDLSAALFRGAVGRSGWQGAATQVLEPLGPVVSRELTGMQVTRSLPGAPDNDYRVLSYRTEFARKAGAVETLTLVREDDGQWRVTGYFVR
jgi:hypothetical protein